MWVVKSEVSLKEAKVTRPFKLRSQLGVTGDLFFSAEQADNQTITGSLSISQLRSKETTFRLATRISLTYLKHQTESKLICRYFTGLNTAIFHAQPDHLNSWKILWIGGCQVIHMSSFWNFQRHQAAGQIWRQHATASPGIIESVGKDDATAVLHRRPDRQCPAWSKCWQVAASTNNKQKKKWFKRLTERCSIRNNHGWYHDIWGVMFHVCLQ